MTKRTKKVSSLSEGTVHDYLKALSKQLSEGVYTKTPSKVFVSNVLGMRYLSDAHYSDIAMVHKEAMSKINKLVASYMVHRVDDSMFENEEMFLKVLEDFSTVCLLSSHIHIAYPSGCANMLYSSMAEYVDKVKDRVVKKLSRLTNTKVSRYELNRHASKIPMIVVATQQPKNDLEEGIDYIRADIGGYAFYILAEPPKYRYI